MNNLWKIVMSSLTMSLVIAVGGAAHAQPAESTEPAEPAESAESAPVVSPPFAAPATPVAPAPTAQPPVAIPRTPVAIPRTPVPVARTPVPIARAPVPIPIPFVRGVGPARSRFSLRCPAGEVFLSTGRCYRFASRHLRLHRHFGYRFPAGYRQPAYRQPAYRSSRFVIPAYRPLRSIRHHRG
jgi:hypothetical protein